MLSACSLFFGDGQLGDLVVQDADRASFLTGMPIWSSMFSMTPSRKAATSDCSIQSIRASSSRIDGLDAGLGGRWRGPAGLGQRRHAHQQTTRGHGRDRFRDGHDGRASSHAGCCRVSSRFKLA